MVGGLKTGVSFRTLILLMMAATPEIALSKSASCARAYAAIEEKIVQYRLNPPTEPLRFFAKDEVVISPMNRGDSFYYKYHAALDPLEQGQFLESSGLQVVFKNSQAQIQKIQIIGSSARRDEIDAVTEMLLKLPAETLEATQKIELQTFLKNTGWEGYAWNNSALGRGIVLLGDGLNPHTFIHEFGHNLAVYIWGRGNPYKEWERAFQLDDMNFVSIYAAREFKKTKYAEDFAEAVVGYLQNTARFRMMFPHRAALLDSIFRDADLWKPIRDRNQTVFAQIERNFEENPRKAMGAVFVTAGGVALVTISKLPPRSPANPR